MFERDTARRTRGFCGLKGWRAALGVYAQPRVLSMLCLGFSAGLPFYLVFQTLSAWLRQSGVHLSTIGMLSWVGIVYSIKILWAPVVDRVPLPGLNRLLGRRRSWMLLAQLGIAVGLLILSWSDPAAGVVRIAAWAVFVAFWAATQDIAVDAWRIESAAVQMQGAMAAAYQIGYRVALIAASAGAFTLADRFGWRASYTTMAALVGVGLATTLLCREPHPTAPRDSGEREGRVIAWVAARAHWPNALRASGAWFVAAVICPLIDYFARYGVRLGLLTLVFMGTYRLTEFTMGSMATPFYIDHGYTLTQIATIVKVYGLLMSLVGVFIGGILIARVGLLRSLVLGSVMIMLSNAGFAALATTNSPTLVGLGLVNGLDNLALGIHGTALIAFLSTLTSPKYTATQYALFSSLYALPGKILEGTSGFVVQAIGYPAFFLYTALLSLPALALLYFLTRSNLYARYRAD
ncbi:MAG TPA: MFS transporter [Steroidobacteraceae bacterium]|jgi:PAT family beta-lactamase induction signal transducer AmpG|nr:MFS transporter [Steroidobacteraceae bacterium]